MEHTYVAIMAGGIGSRFWPQSRTHHPKQFIDILGTGESLLQATYRRFTAICPPEHIYILTNQQYLPLVKEQIPGINDEQLMGEPMRKNTAPCIAWFATKIRELDSKAVMVISPADHMVLKESSFVEVISKGLEFARWNDSLITLGIKPSRPDTGYGYIQFDEDAEKEGVYKVKTFTEKPTLKIAKSFLKSGDFLWNSGLFIWSAKTIYNAFRENLPEVLEAFTNVMRQDVPDEYPLVREAFSLCPSVSIDYGVMEKADNVYVIPADFGWSDLGTWDSLYANYEKDYLGNAVSGKNVIIYDAQDCMVMADDKKLVVLQGLEGFIVVDTPDALLICKRDKEQEIKQITQDIKRKLGDDYA